MLRLIIASVFWAWVALAAAQEPANDPGAELKAITDEYDKAAEAFWEQFEKTREEKKDAEPDMSKHPARQFLPRVEAFAKKHAGQPAAIPALCWIIENSQDAVPGSEDKLPAVGEWAFEQITTVHAGQKEVADALRTLSRSSWVLGEQKVVPALERIESANPEPGVKASALFYQGVVYHGYDPKPEAVAKSRPLFERVLKEFPDSEAAKKCEPFLFEINNLQVGMKAPELEGTDAEGKTITLSSLRGQVVVLDFFGFW